MIHAIGMLMIFLISDILAMGDRYFMKKFYSFLPFFLVVLAMGLFTEFSQNLPPTSECYLYNNSPTLGVERYMSYRAESTPLFIFDQYSQHFELPAQEWYTASGRSLSAGTGATIVSTAGKLLACKHMAYYSSNFGMLIFVLWIVYFTTREALDGIMEVFKRL